MCNLKTGLLVVSLSLLASTTAPLHAGGWSAETRLTATRGEAELPINFARAVAVDERGGIHAVWFETHGSTSQVVYRHSRDGGLHWEPALRLSLGRGTSTQPALAVFQRAVYVAWQDLRPSWRPASTASRPRWRNGRTAGRSTPGARSTAASPGAPTSGSPPRPESPSVPR